MKNKNRSLVVDTKKVVFINLLFTISVLIMASGLFFIIFSLVNHISFQVLNAKVHGAILGLTVSYLGLRYFLSVQTLETEVYKTTSKFSWSNFKRNKR